MKEKEIKRDKKRKLNIIFIVGIILLILELIMIPVLVLTSVTKIIPIVCFMGLPLLATLIIVFYGNTLNKKIKEKNNQI